MNDDAHDTALTMLVDIQAAVWKRQAAAGLREEKDGFTKEQAGTTPQQTGADSNTGATI